VTARTADRALGALLLVMAILVGLLAFAVTDPVESITEQAP
jgi:hypothetical protein